MHSHEHETSTLNTAFSVGIILNLAFVIIEAAAGLIVHSLALLSDAGHNLADVGGLALSLFAYRMLSVKSSSRYTYGFSKTSILAALANAVILLISIGAMAYESVMRLLQPEPLSGAVIAVVAGIGVVINAISALLFLRNKHADINIRSAYVHLMSDAVIALGIVVAGIAIMYTGWFWLDPVVCLVVVVTILFSTWRLLRESVRMSLDAVPENIELEEVKAAARAIPGVKDLHHVHIWNIGVRENALTAHLVLSHGATVEQEHQIKQELKHELKHRNINHVTLETERDNEGCPGEEC